MRNALAAALTARLAGAPVDGVRTGLRTARALPHRMEPVLEREGVLWINDSKATNVSATASALASLRRPAVVLLGGKDKGEDLTPLIPLLRAHARVVVTFGAAGHRLAEAVGATLPVERMGDDFEAVVAHARRLAMPGDVVILSPACSSFDMFESYEHRGNRFAALVREAA